MSNFALLHFNSNLEEIEHFPGVSFIIGIARNLTVKRFSMVNCISANLYPVANSKWLIRGSSYKRYTIEVDQHCCVANLYVETSSVLKNVAIRIHVCVLLVINNVNLHFYQ